jgi:dihydrodiol dehydrogenase / D-xylose 1-dehydrogenase (NADP)
MKKSKKIRWGIIGCGTIAHRFAHDLAYSKHGCLAAVASRKTAKAKQFAEQFKIARFYGSYEQLANDRDIDAVYVATPHSFHMNDTLMAIDAGKAVLCEKPFAMNARQVRRMEDAAAKKGVFLMEGMWTRFFPAVRLLNQWLAEKKIGDVFSLHAEFGFRFNFGPEHRLLNLKLGGGALLDLGIYVVSFASMVFGRQPDQIKTTVHYAKTGADDQSSLLFQYPDGKMATLSCSSRILMEQRVCIYGSQGMIRVVPDFFHPSCISLVQEGKREISKKFPHPGLGFQYEADHVAECIMKGKLQSQIMPLQESLDIIKTMDKIRKQWHLKYPNE